MRRAVTTHASAARTATNVSEIISVPPDTFSIVVIVDITANPGGADTIQAQIQALDQASGKFLDWTNFAVLTAATNATFVKSLADMAGSATARAPGVANFAELIGPLPPEIRIRIVHSAGTSFTYSVGVYFS